jgi:uncharacterized protein YbbK (DUF523 family)
VHYDGGHKRDAFLVEVFGRYVEWVPVCPEVEMGLGVPRDTLRLERQGDDTRLIMPKTGADYTESDDASDALACHWWTAHRHIHTRASHVHIDGLRAIPELVTVP